MSTVNTSKKRDAPSQEVLQRVREVREKYRCEYIESMDLRIPGDPIRMSVSENGILVGSRRSAGGSFAGTIFSRPLSGETRFARVIDEFPTGTTGPCVRMIPEENSVIYTRLIDGQILPLKYGLSTGREFPFEPLHKRKFVNISSIKVYDDVLVLSDVFSHIIVEYSTTGKLIREITLPDGYEYPAGVERTDDGFYVVALQQDHAKKSHPEYSKRNTLAESYLILMDGSGNVIKDITGISRHIFKEEAVRGITEDKNGNYYILTSSHIIKANTSFEKIYEADLLKCSMRFPDSERRLSRSSVFFNLEYLDGKLYLLEPMTNKKIYVFDVG